MKHLQLFENYNNINSIKLEDVIVSVEDYIYQTFTVHANKKDEGIDNPYGCDSANGILADMDMDDLYNVYNIPHEKEDKHFWKHQNFLNMMKDENCFISLPRRFNYIKSQLLKLGNPITIWRCMSVNDEYIKKFMDGNIEKLGKYWTYSTENLAAINHQKLEHLIAIKCSVDSKYVDFEKTILFNLNYSVGSSESEIILIPDAELKLDSVLITTKEMIERFFPFFNKQYYKELNIQHLKSKTFKN